MKKILGLDLGTASIGWAVVNEAETSDEKSSIVKLGVRTISYDNFVSSEKKTESKTPELDFNSGKGISPNAGRTLKRSMRRNLQRYKLRREHLRKILKESGFIDEETILQEKGNATTFETYRLRAKAASEKISLSEFARVLLMINKKRGYKSSRKAKSNEEGALIDGMEVAKELHEKNKTPGQFVHELYQSGKNYVPDFYRSDLQDEWKRIWDFQKQFYPEQMTDSVALELSGKNAKETMKICQKNFGVVGEKRAKKGVEQKKEDYEWRANAVSGRLTLEQLTVVFQNINSQINASSGYLGAIGDRSKELYFNHLTVGQYQMKKLAENPNYSLKNQVFYRQDYWDEFEKIWKTQAQFHPELTDDLKRKIQDEVLFYQRPLRSQKNLVGICELEGREIEIKGENDKKSLVRIGPKVCPKSMPLFQEFRIWQTLDNVELINKETGTCESLSDEQRKRLFDELNCKEKLSASKLLKTLFEKNAENFEINFDEIKGNTTQAKLLSAYQKIIDANGLGEWDFSKKDANEVFKIVSDAFEKLHFKTDFLSWNSELPSPEFENQKLFRLWHLLYSFEGDSSLTGDEGLVEKIMDICGFSKESAKILASVTFENDYGSLSAKAMKKILPWMKKGEKYSEACEAAGYRHSKRSLTREELEKKVYREQLALLPKNSLRNPVVEKILNQMVNVVNAVVDAYGKPDEIRIELSRELKKSAKERKEMAEQMGKASKEYDNYRKELKETFGITNPSKNDLIRYRLYKELEKNGCKTLYSNREIKKDRLFTKDYDIEHIIPQAKRFDDSFANKTLELREVNLKKGNSTAFDFVSQEYGESALEQYQERIERLFKEGVIGKAKRKNLLMTNDEIPEGFIERDLRDSQYIAKKAREMLEELVPFVVPTVGSITDRLRDDWQLVDVMKELNWAKYDKQGLTEIVEDKDGRKIGKIKDWTKRNDHRHHAMDALTIAFTKRSFIQYLNNLNARLPKSMREYIDLAEYDLSQIDKNDVKKVVASIEAKELEYDHKGHLRFKPPMPLEEFRAEAKRHLEETLISIKSRNKVVTKNVNKTKGKNQDPKKRRQETLTPRGQLHNETIYGSCRKEIENVKELKVGIKLTLDKIDAICNPRYREALKKRLLEFNGDSKLAFTGKNALSKNPIFLDESHSEQVPDTVKVKLFETVYTIRKAVDANLSVDKVLDKKIREILQKRLEEFGGDAKSAFSNLDQNPIWQNKEKGIAIKRVVVKAVNNAIALHQGRDFVNPGNNHHVAIYRDANGDLQEKVVSFYEATQRAVRGMPAVDRDYKKEEGWEFLFTMKINEMFVFPNEKTGFDPSKIDLLDLQNYAQISPNLFRVQKLSTKFYVFRHHQETTVNEEKRLKDITWKRITAINNLKGAIKVRVNHIGQIVSVGEY